MMTLQRNHGLALRLIAGSILLSLNQSVWALNPPPTEAIQACSNSAQGNSCNIQTPNGNLTGMCMDINAQLACVPNQGNGAPPPMNQTNNISSSNPSSELQNIGTSTTSGNTTTNNSNNTSDNFTPVNNPQGATQSSSSTSSDTSSASNNVSIDSSTSTLILPVVVIEGSNVYYNISLDVIGYNPLTLRLASADLSNSSSTVNATYNSQNETLIIPSLVWENQVTSATFTRTNDFTIYQFQLSDMQTAAFPVVDTGQFECFDSNGNSTSCSASGQDGAYQYNIPSYSDNGDGTVTDLITGLMWQQGLDSNNDGSIDANDKMTQSQAVSYCDNLVLANRSDWRLPNIKTMYSLINFNGEDPISDNTNGLIPFIDTEYFDFVYGDTNAGERVIDRQYATSTLYVSTTMSNSSSMFGVNLADGRIKGYPTSPMQNGEKTFVVQCVRGQTNYAQNSLIDNSDGTISDLATRLMWEKSDSQTGMDWNAAIAYCESGASGGYSDWRLPNAKELQSIVDYTRSPDSTQSAAINSIFNATSFINEAGQTDWGFYWSNTSHKKANGTAQHAAYVAFGRALGYMNNNWLDVHGAGAQRSAPKSYSNSLDNQMTVVTDANGNQALVHGPQGDLTRTDNMVRCVRNID